MMGNKEMKHVSKWQNGNKLGLDLGNTNFIIFHSTKIHFVKLLI